MKKRVDLLLVEKGLATGREKAKDLIKNDQVFINNVKCSKPSDMVEEIDEIEIKGEILRYVSRGGLKLEKAIEVFNIELEGMICADIGASTGGFTDCMLINGAQKVYSIDVGHGQLAEKLKQDNRVVNLEGTNVRNLNSEIISQKLDFISIDVSFISLSIVIPSVVGFLDLNGKIVCLIKPQFEAGKENIGKKGVVKSRKVHISVVNNFIAMIHANGLYINNITFSPIKGPEGNIEYLAFLSKTDYTENMTDAATLIDTAFKELS